MAEEPGTKFEEDSGIRSERTDGTGSISEVFQLYPDNLARSDEGTCDSSSNGQECRESEGNSQSNVIPNSKYRYYYKNFIVFNATFMLSYTAIYASLNLLTTIAGQTLGFTALAVFAFVAFISTFFTLPLLRSFGTQRMLKVTQIAFFLFIASQFYVSYATLIPAAILIGLATSFFWICGVTYLNKLAVDYGDEYGIGHEKMISFANGSVLGCYTGGALLGSALSSSILLPSGLDEQSVAVGNESCNLEQSTDHIDPYNKYLMILRGVLLLCALVSSIIVLLFLDKLKSESVKSTWRNILFELKQSNIEFFATIVLKKTYILLGLPLVMITAVVESFIFGSFAKTYISECVGVHMVGYATMVYALFAASSCFLTGKMFLAYSPRCVVAIITTILKLSLSIFLIIWERQPSYVFVFVFITLWGITDGTYMTFASSYIGHMLHKEIDIAYMCYTVLFTLGYFVSFISGVFLDTQGIVYLNGGLMIVSLPIYLLAEWIHHHHHHIESDLKNGDDTETNSDRTPDCLSDDEEHNSVLDEKIMH